MFNMDENYPTCTGNSETCKVYECWLCGERDCPHKAEEHYWHDGCPACYHCKGCIVCNGKTYKQQFQIPNLRG